MLAERKVVTKIEANPLLAAREKERPLVRVAAYCRVSTDKEDQLHSLAAQQDYLLHRLHSQKSGLALCRYLCR